MREINQGFNQAVLRQLEKWVTTWPKAQLTKLSWTFSPVNHQQRYHWRCVKRKFLAYHYYWLAPLYHRASVFCISVFDLLLSLVGRNRPFPVATPLLTFSSRQSNRSCCIQMHIHKALPKSCTDLRCVWFASFLVLQPLFRPVSQWLDHMQRQHIILWGLAQAPTCHR